MWLNQNLTLDSSPWVVIIVANLNANVTGIACCQSSISIAINRVSSMLAAFHVS